MAVSIPSAPEPASTTSALPAAGRAFVTRGYGLGFALVVSVFFAWALANNLNDILIRQFQKALSLSRGEAGFIQFVFYLAYFLWAIPAGLLLRRFGYRIGLVTGMGLYMLGALMFYPASLLQEYDAFLAALFVLASGAAFLETAANPFVVRFGDPARASQRLNLAQAFNGLGAVIAPAIGGLFIFSGIEHSDAQIASMTPAQVSAYRAAEAANVQGPYLVLAGLALILAIALAIVRLPAIARSESGSADTGNLRQVLQNRQLVRSVIAQFFYVGAQVGIWSYFVDFVKYAMPETPEKTAAYYLSGSLLLFMIGRFLGAALMQRIAPARLLAVFSSAAVLLCAAAMVLEGGSAVIALGCVSFFMSIMFPTIFALGVRDLGTGTAIGSSLIIMAIIGGALFPPLMGYVSQVFSLQPALALPLFCFAAIGLFARHSRIAEAQDSRKPS